MLTVTNASGFGAGGIITPATITFTASTYSATSTTTHSFASQSFGDAAGDRKILVAMNACRAPTSTTSCTIGGVSGTLIKTQGQSAGGVVAFYLASVPTGTTGTVSCVFPTNTTGGAGIGVWRLTGTSSTATATAGAGYGEGVSTNYSLSVNVDDGGVAIAASTAGNSAGTPHTMVWTGVTENYDTQINTNDWHSGGSVFKETGATPLAIVGNPDSTPHRAGIACSFPPE